MAIDIFRNRLTSLGRAPFHLAFPNDVELYLLTLELSTSEGQVVDILTFPINPSSVSEQPEFTTSVKKTAKSVTAIQNPTFHPISINMSGNFGTNLRILSERGPLSLEGFSLNRVEEYEKEVQEEIERIYGQEFNPVIKTGYGITRVLRKMIELSRQRNDKGPFILRYYNAFSGSSYVVVVTSFNVSMNESKNFVWDYSIGLKAIAQADNVRFSTLNTGMAFRQSILRVAAEFLDRRAEQILNDVIF